MYPKGRSGNCIEGNAMAKREPKWRKASRITDDAWRN